MKFENIVIHTDYSCLTGGVEEQILTLTNYYFTNKMVNKILIVNSDTYYGHTEIKKEFVDSFDEIYICNDPLSFQNFKNRIPSIDNQNTCVLSLKPFAFRMFSDYFINSKVILQFRGDIDKRYYKTFRDIYEQISFDFFGVMSDEMLYEFPYISMNKNVELINFGTYYKFNKIKIDYNKKYNSKNISIVSRISREKKIEDLINIIGKLPENDFVFNIYGDYDTNEVYTAYYNELVDLIEKLNLQNKIKFKGYVDTLDKIYCDSFILIHSSETEGIPRGVIEAAFHGTPSILKNSFVMAKYIVCEEYMCCSNEDQFIEAVVSFSDMKFEDYVTISNNAISIARKFEIDTEKLDSLFLRIYEYKNNRNKYFYDKINVLEPNMQQVKKVNELLEKEKSKSKFYLNIIKEYDNRKYIKTVRILRKKLGVDK